MVIVAWVQLEKLRSEIEGLKNESWRKEQRLSEETMARERVLTMVRESWVISIWQAEALATANSERAALANKEVAKLREAIQQVCSLFHLCLSLGGQGKNPN